MGALEPIVPFLLQDHLFSAACLHMTWRRKNYQLWISPTCQSKLARHSSVTSMETLNMKTFLPTDWHYSKLLISMISLTWKRHAMTVFWKILIRKMYWRDSRMHIHINCRNWRPAAWGILWGLAKYLTSVMISTSSCSVQIGIWYPKSSMKFSVPGKDSENGLKLLWKVC